VRDAVSGHPVTRLTSGVGHHHHLYFTNDGWRSPRELFVAAHDADGNDCWVLDIEEHVATRLTAFGRHDVNWTSAVKNPVGDEIFNAVGDEIVAIDCGDGAVRTIGRGPEGFASSNLGVTADGAAVLAPFNRRLEAAAEDVDAGPSGAKLRDPSKERCECLIAEFPTDGSGMRVLHESGHWLGHPIGSPTDSDLLTFCHEGPWLEIDQRIWAMRRGDGEPWPVIPKDPEWGVGHEFWLADGATLGYHARRRGDDWGHCAGFVRYDNTGHWQAELACPTHHAHAATRELMVLDGTRRTGEYLMLAERDGDAWARPRILCRHASSRHHHFLHVHARIADDQRRIVFTSDKRGYGDVYLIDLPGDLAALPEYDGPPYMYYWQ